MRDRIRAMGLTLALVLAAGAAGCNKPTVEKATLAVQGMTCSSCEQGIEAEVGRLEGVRSVQASHTAKTARVEFDSSKVTLETIIETINKLGYKAARDGR